MRLSKHLYLLIWSGRSEILFAEGDEKTGGEIFVRKIAQAENPLSKSFSDILPVSFFSSVFLRSAFFT